VQASPTSNSLLDRLKTLATQGTALAALIGEVQASPTSLTLLDRLKTLATSATTMIASLAQIAKPSKGEYETVAAGQTDQVLGATGAAGDYLKGLIIVPAVVACGVVTIKDGAGGAISIFVGGGTTALVDAKPFFVPLDLVSLAGAWSVTTGANVSVIAVGDFT
jgi:hypothetical protein